MAAKQYDFLRVVISGLIEATQTWSVRVAFTCNPNTSQDDLNAWTLAAVPDVINWWTARQGSPQQENTADTVLNNVRSYIYLAGQVGAHLVAEAPLAASNGTSTTPGTARDSLVVSFYGLSPGRHNRGRIYIPTTGPQLGADHNFALGTSTNFLKNTQDLFVALHARQLGGATLVPIIASSQPLPTPIHSLRCDTLPDTQRVRSNKVPVDGEYIAPLFAP